MIGKITGRIDYKASDHLLIDVQGVGYIVYCSERTLAELPAQGQIAAVYTDLLVREDNLQLFGFLSLADKEWHRLLTTVQGVGAKAALAIAGVLGTEGVSRAIALGDVAAIKSAPGVGPKIAQRVVAELKEKAPKIMAMGAMGQAPVQVDDFDVIETPALQAEPKASANSGNSAAQADALSALVNLGYGHGDAAGAIAQATPVDQEMSSQEIIKAALKLLAGN